MNKQELAVAIANKTNFQKKDAERMITAFTEVVKEALVSEDKIVLAGFGSFEVVERAARTGRNPQTGETIEIGASKSPKFKAGKALKDAVKA